MLEEASKKDSTKTVLIVDISDDLVEVDSDPGIAGAKLNQTDASSSKSNGSAATDKPAASEPPSPSKPEVPILFPDTSAKVLAHATKSTTSTASTGSSGKK